MKPGRRVKALEIVGISHRDRTANFFEGKERMTMQWPRTIGILGGLGPRAHVEFESRLLAEARALGAKADQDYPPWILVSAPQTPDRSQAITGNGPSPAPILGRALERLAVAGADFALVPCVTAHVFLESLTPPLPLLSLVEAALDEVLAQFGETAQIGVLATNGTLASGLFPRIAARYAPGIILRTLLDLPEGREIQEEWVMRPIFGSRKRDGSLLGGGIKGGYTSDPESGSSYREMLSKAVDKLSDDGAEAVVCGCTELPLVLKERKKGGPRLIDPLQVGAKAALEVAAGLRPLPGASRHR